MLPGGVIRNVAFTGAPNQDRSTLSALHGVGGGARAAPLEMSSFKATVKRKNAALINPPVAMSTDDEDDGPKAPSTSKRGMMKGKRTAASGFAGAPGPPGVNLGTDNLNAPKPRTFGENHPESASGGARVSGQRKSDSRFGNDGYLKTSSTAELNNLVAEKRKAPDPREVGTDRFYSASDKSTQPFKKQKPNVGAGTAYAQRADSYRNGAAQQQDAAITTRNMAKQFAAKPPNDKGNSKDTAIELPDSEEEDESHMPGRQRFNLSRSSSPNAAAAQSELRNSWSPHDDRFAATRNRPESSNVRRSPAKNIGTQPEQDDSRDEIDLLSGSNASKMLRESSMQSGSRQASSKAPTNNKTLSLTIPLQQIFIASTGDLKTSSAQLDIDAREITLSWRWTNRLAGSHVAFVKHDLKSITRCEDEDRPLAILTLQRSYRVCPSLRSAAPQFDTGSSQYEPQIICYFEPFGQWHQFTKIIKAAGIEHPAVDHFGAKAVCEMIQQTVASNASSSTGVTSGTRSGTVKPKPRASAKNKDKQRETEESAKQLRQQTIDKYQQPKSTQKQPDLSDLPVNDKKASSKAAPTASSSRTMQTRAAASNKTTAVNDGPCLRYPPDGPGAVTAYFSDVDKLAEGEFLNDTIIELGLKMQFDIIKREQPELADRIYIFSSFFYLRLQENSKDKDKAYEMVRKWAKIDIFKKQYLVVPINEHLHWYLAIVVNPYYCTDPQRREAARQAKETAAAIAAANAPPKRVTRKSNVVQSDDDADEEREVADVTGAVDDLAVGDASTSAALEQDTSNTFSAAQGQRTDDETIRHGTHLVEQDYEQDMHLHDAANARAPTVGQDLEMRDVADSDGLMTPPREERLAPSDSVPRSPIFQPRQRSVFGSHVSSAAFAEKGMQSPQLKQAMQIQQARSASTSSSTVQAKSARSAPQYDSDVEMADISQSQVKSHIPLYDLCSPEKPVPPKKTSPYFAPSAPVASVSAFKPHQHHQSQPRQSTFSPEIDELDESGTPRSGYPSGEEESPPPQSQRQGRVRPVPLHDRRSSTREAESQSRPAHPISQEARRTPYEQAHPASSHMPIGTHGLSRHADPALLSGSAGSRTSPQPRVHYRWPPYEKPEPEYAFSQRAESPPDGNAGRGKLLGGGGGDAQRKFKAVIPLPQAAPPSDDDDDDLPNAGDALKQAAAKAAKKRDQEKLRKAEKRRQASAEVESLSSAPDDDDVLPRGKAQQKKKEKQRRVSIDSTESDASPTDAKARPEGGRTYGKNSKPRASSGKPPRLSGAPVRLKDPAVAAKLTGWLETSTVVCVFDSLGGKHGAVRTNLRNYLARVYREQKRTEAAAVIAQAAPTPASAPIAAAASEGDGDEEMAEVATEVIRAEVAATDPTLAEGADVLESIGPVEHIDVIVPMQPNFCDCGVYMLHYFKCFFDAPEVFVKEIIPTRARDAEQWKHPQLPGARAALREKVNELKSAYEIKTDAARKAKEKEKETAARIKQQRELDEKSAEAAKRREEDGGVAPAATASAVASSSTLPHAAHQQQAIGSAERPSQAAADIMESFKPTAIKSQDAKEKKEKRKAEQSAATNGAAIEAFDVDAISDSHAPAVPDAEAAQEVEAELPLAQSRPLVPASIAAAAEADADGAASDDEIQVVEAPSAP